MELFSGLDWISATFKQDYPQRWRSCVHPADTGTKQEAKPRNGYTRATIHASGATQSVNDNRPDMGIHVVYPGSAITQMSDLYGVSQKQLLEHLCIGAKITRMDVRIDCLDSGLNIETLYKMAKAGDVQTQSRSVGYQESAKRGNAVGAPTCYIGSLKRRTKLLRVYDKGAQNGDLIDLKRFELELHRAPAITAANGLIAADLTQWAEHIGGLIKGYCYWPSDEIVANIFSDFSKCVLNVPEVLPGKTVIWLLNVCAPALARSAAFDSGIIVEFMHRVKEELDALGAIDKKGTCK